MATSSKDNQAVKHHSIYNTFSEEKQKYKLKSLDFSKQSCLMLVFFAFSMFGQNVIRCLFKFLSKKPRGSLPICLSSSSLFVVASSSHAVMASPLTNEYSYISSQGTIKDKHFYIFISCLLRTCTKS
ncbi:hypothetical protein YC2023_100254 [Brassica napus]